jgi:DNA-binding transcriptional ArsR family regulator
MPAERLRLEAAVTPRFDIFYALYTLANDASSALDEWKELARRRLPRDFDRGASRLAPLPIFWPLLADALQGVRGKISFDDMLDFLKGIAPRDLQRDILSGIFHDVATVDSLVSSRRNLKQVLADEDLHGAELAGHFGLRPYKSESAAVRAVVYLLDAPEAYRDDLISILRGFWETGFRDDWQSIEGRLRDAVATDRDSARGVRSDVSGKRLELPVALDDNAREIRPRNGSPIRYNRIDRCYVVPSAFNTRKWWAKYEIANGKLTLYLPALVRSAISAATSRARRQPVAPHERAPEIDAEIVFRALGDTTRYAIASILARSPTTSAELARSLNVSKPTITHHVQALRAAGLLLETPSGGSTTLTLRQDTLEGLSAAAIGQLFTSRGDLTLATTRKRRGGKREAGGGRREAGGGKREAGAGKRDEEAAMGRQQI